MKKTTFKNKKNGKWWFFAAISFIVFFWSLVVHPFEFPDEQAHLGSVEFLSREGKMPVGEEKDMTEEMRITQEYLGVYRNAQGQNKYTYHPEYHVDYTNSTLGKYENEIKSLSVLDFQDEYVGTESARYPALYYRYENIFLHAVENQDILTRLYFLRLGGVVLAYILAYFVYKLGLLIFAKAVYARTLTIMVMLMPMMSFVMAGINSDNLHNLLFTIVIYAGLKLILHGFTASTALTAFVTVTLDLYTKPQGIIAFPTIALAALIAVIKYKNWKLLGLTSLGALIIMVIGWDKISPYLSLLSGSNPHNASFVEYVRFSLNKLVAQNVVWFWGVFKWLGVVLPPLYWRIANRVVVLSVVGFAVYLYKVVKRNKVVAPLLTLSYLLLTVLIYSLAIYYFDWTYTKNVGFSIGVQARYFYPVIAPIFALMLTGLLSYGLRASHRILIRRGIILLFIWLQLGGVLTVIRSYYTDSSLKLLITQMSQYKPWWGKGEIWYLWIIIYVLSLMYLITKAWTSRKKTA